jgi:hypothetical protein
VIIPAAAAGSRPELCQILSAAEQWQLAAVPGHTHSSASVSLRQQAVCRDLEAAVFEALMPSLLWGSCVCFLEF